MSLLEHFKTILISSLSNIFSVAESTNNYKVITTIANEIDIANTNLDELRKAISLNQALSGDLDLFGFQMSLQRINNEEDEDYRQRLLSSYDREYITKNNLQKLASDYSISYPKIEESIYDRWWLGGSPLPDRQVETLNATADVKLYSEVIIDINDMDDAYDIGPITELNIGDIIDPFSYFQSLFFDQATAVVGILFQNKIYLIEFLTDYTIVGITDDRIYNIQSKILHWFGDLGIHQGLVAVGNGYQKELVLFQTHALDSGAPLRTPINQGAYASSIVMASSGILANTIPDCFLITDTTNAGTNYCSGCSFTNTTSGSIITLTTAVSAGTQLNVTYIPNQSTSGENIDWVPLSFISNDMIIKHRNMSNNYTPIETTATYIKIQTNMLPGYKAYTMYTDDNNGIVYSWESIVDNNGMITLQESNRTDSLITNEFQISNDSSTVTTSYDITKVVGVFLSSDIAQVGINYATDNNFNGRIITLNTPLPQKIGVIVTYNKNAIKNYTLLSNNLFTKTGFDDLRFTIEVQITQPFLKYGTFKYGTARWGQLANELTGTLGQLIDTAKATGIKASVVLVTKGTFYGADDAVYAQVWYGGSYY